MIENNEKNYEKLQYKEQEKTNFVLWINTVFTVITGVATLVLAIIQYLHK